MTFIKNNMNINISPAKFTVSALAIGIMALTSNIASAASSKITNLTSSQVNSNTTQVKVSFDGLPVIPKAYQIDDDRLLLEFESVESMLPDQKEIMQKGMVTSSQSESSNDHTRIIINLTEKASYNTQIIGSNLILTMKPANKKNITSESRVENRQKSIAVTPIVESNNQGNSKFLTPQNSSDYIFANNKEAVKKTKQQNDSQMNIQVSRPNPLMQSNLSSQHIAKEYNYDGLSSVNFSGNGNGGDVVINLKESSIPVDVQRKGDKIIVRLTGATVPNHLVRQLKINDAVVSSVNANNSGNNGVIAISMSKDFEYQAYQAGSKLNISISPAKVLKEPTLEEKKYSGEPLSLDFQDVSVRNVLDILAQFTDMNVVASDSVTGKVTLKLMNVPWDQALDIIMTSKGLAKRENGNVIWVAPASEINKFEKDQLEALQSKKDVLPLRTETIRLNYAKAPVVGALISESRGSGNGGKKDDSSSSLLSMRGSISVDERTNMLIVKDTSESITNIRALIEKIDIPVKQVMVEARIVSATDSFSKEIGVKWGILSNGAATNRNLIVGASDQTMWDLKDFDVETATVNGQSVSYPSYTISRPDNLNVDLGVSNPAGQIAFGLLQMSNFMIDLELSAMQADGRGEVISTPKVLTTDKQTAKIVSGTQIPYQEASASGATAISFKEAALSLEVTPNITPDGKIGLELLINNDSPRALPNGTIAIDTNSINTNVVVEDGQTIVLGGVFKNYKSTAVKKVPFLGDLPYVGRLFRKDVERNDKEELLIFVTPKLITDGTTRYN